ncbi:hypothetical protein U9M48_032880 [Paspalum notatum var. saurae]|uniref:Uncharacterized protein n=1 Tax=Paspalum notatum var. saurae TaxID=547442 RepID=A0AAQ3X5F8_PASNO
MRKEMIIRVHTSSEKGHGKAIKVAAAISEKKIANIYWCARRRRSSGVESVTLAGEDKNLLLVIGVGIDSDRITKKLRRKVGHAEVVELRTVDGAKDDLGALVAADHAYRYHTASPSPYKQHHHAGARDHYYAAGGSPYALQMAPGSYYYGAGGGGYPVQSYQQHGEYLYQYHPATTANTHTVVHHEYASDPNSCSVM